MHHFARAVLQIHHFMHRTAKGTVGVHVPSHRHSCKCDSTVVVVQAEVSRS